LNKIQNRIITFFTINSVLTEKNLHSGVTFKLSPFSVTLSNYSTRTCVPQGLEQKRWEFGA